MDATNLPKGQSRERNDGGDNLPGVYVHRDTKAKFITAEGEEGVIQADALMSPVWKDAWERVGDAPSGLESLKARKDRAAKGAKTEKNPKIKLELEQFATS